MKTEDIDYIFWYYRGWVVDLLKDRRFLAIAATVAIVILLSNMKGT